MNLARFIRVAPSLAQVDEQIAARNEQIERLYEAVVKMRRELRGEL